MDGSVFGLSQAQRVDAEAALKVLEPHGATLQQAANFYVENLDVIKASKPVTEAVAELVQAKERDRRSARYLQDLRNRLETFSRSPEFSERPVHAVTAKDIEDWLRSLDVGPVTRNNFRRILGVFFSFAVKRRYALRNPIPDVDVASFKIGKPAILTVPECRALLACAAAEIVPAVVLAMFAGLRPESELFRLDWSAIDLQDRTVDITRSTPYLTSKELKEFLKLPSVKVIDQMVARGQLPVTKLGHRTRRFHLPAVLKALEGLTVNAR